MSKDFENDVLPWLSGEMAFGLLPPAAESPASIGQLALVAEVAHEPLQQAFLPFRVESFAFFFQHGASFA